jgi:hypothetical protein
MWRLRLAAPGSRRPASSDTAPLGVMRPAAPAPADTLACLTFRTPGREFFASVAVSGFAVFEPATSRGLPPRGHPR